MTTDAYRSGVRKFFRRMVPLVVFMLVVNQMDRTNVGFVQSQFKHDLGIGSAAFGLGAGLFFVGYALFEVPSNMMLGRVGARVWLTRIMITWGAVVAATAFTTDSTTYYIMRFLLGVTEAGFFPGVLLYFTKWLPNAERGRAGAIFLGGSATAYIVTGPISGALLNLDGVRGLAGWKWMFLLEGGLSIAVGLVAALFLVSRIDEAKWLTAQEKSAMNEAIARDEAERTDVATAKISRWRLLANPQVLLLCWVFFAMSLVGYAITFWLPSIIKKIHGLGNFQVGLVSAVPWILAVIAMYALAHYTDRTGVRRPWVAIGMAVGAIGAALATVGPPWFALVGLCLGAIGAKCAASAFWPMSQHTLDLKIAAAGIALINSIGNLGGFFGPTIVGYFDQQTGSTASGLRVVAIAELLAAVTVFAIRARRDRTAEPAPVV